MIIIAANVVIAFMQLKPVDDANTRTKFINVQLIIGSIKFAIRIVKFVKQKKNCFSTILLQAKIGHFLNDFIIIEFSSVICD